MNVCLCVVEFLAGKSIFLFVSVANVCNFYQRQTWDFSADRRFSTD